MKKNQNFFVIIHKENQAQILFIIYFLLFQFQFQTPKFRKLSSFSIQKKKRKRFSLQKKHF